MEIFEYLLGNPLYIVLCGSGGILVIIISLIALKNKKENGISINIDVNSNKNRSKIRDQEYNLEFESKPIIDKREEYDYLDFDSEEYYVTFLKTIEEKRKRGDKFEYK